MNQYNNNYNYNRLKQQRDEIDSFLSQMQPQQQTNLIELRVLNENEDIRNVYVQNKTLFIGTKKMALKGIDGAIEEWEIKKTYPIDEKDIKINQLESQIEELKVMLQNGYKQSNESINTIEQSNANANFNVESTTNESAKPIQREDNAGTSSGNSTIL